MLSEKEIVQKIICRAIENGYTFAGKIHDCSSFSISSYDSQTERLAMVFNGNGHTDVVYDGIKFLLFDVDFAKAAFGNEWEKHLQQLAVSSDKLKYLRETLDLNNPQST